MEFSFFVVCWFFLGLTMTLRPWWCPSIVVYKQNKIQHEGSCCCNTHAFPHVYDILCHEVFRVYIGKRYAEQTYFWEGDCCLSEKFFTFNGIPKFVAVVVITRLENREYGRRDPSRWPRSTFYPHKLAITSPTSGGRSVGIVHSRAQTMEFSFSFS
jgi:hypothetical protein